MINRTASQRTRFFEWTPGTTEEEHCHPQSAQLTVVQHGKLELITPVKRHLVGAGQVAFCPPSCRHSIRASDGGSCKFFVVVAPNREPPRVTKDFPAGSEMIDASVSSLDPGFVVMPSSPDASNAGAGLRVDLLVLPPGRATGRVTLHEQERLIYIVDGVGFLNMKYVSGTLTSGALIHVPREYPHQIRNAGKDSACRVLVVTVPPV